jgi:hypothetical protein
VLGKPARRVVLRVEPHLALSLSALLGATVGQAMLQALTSSSSFCASAMTFWATCVGTSS